MQTKIWLNDIDLQDSVPNALINRVIVSPVEIKTNYADRLRGGRALMQKQRSHMLITLQAQIKGGRYPVARAEAIDALNAWAAPGGWLRLSNRPGKRILVNTIKLASEETVHGKAEVAEIQFSADASPYWEDIEPHAFQFRAANNQGVYSERVNYTAESLVELTATVTGTAALTHMMVRCAGMRGENPRKIELNGLNIENGEQLYLTYSDDGIMSITTQYGVSCLNKLTSDSDDVLTVPGKPGLSLKWSINAQATVDVRIRGRWL